MERVAGALQQSCDLSQLHAFACCSSNRLLPLSRMFKLDHAIQRVTRACTLCFGPFSELHQSGALEKLASLQNHTVLASLYATNQQDAFAL
jgi:hypothetical protein